jgi:hypothetical protein
MEFVDENNNIYIEEQPYIYSIKKEVEVPENYELIISINQDEHIKVLSFKYETGRSSKMRRNYC